jgi:hypothetical protein
VRDFRELEVWHRSHRLTLDLYEATVTFPAKKPTG